MAYAWEAEIRKITIRGQPEEKVNETPSQPRVECSGVCLSSQLCGRLRSERL
jgi:hypothetical protein